MLKHEQGKVQKVTQVNILPYNREFPTQPNFTEIGMWIGLRTESIVPSLVMTS